MLPAKISQIPERELGGTRYYIIVVLRSSTGTALTDAATLAGGRVLENARTQPFAARSLLASLGALA
jgi:hypothetical protein